jgi:hypothetical protein
MQFRLYGLHMSSMYACCREERETLEAKQRKQAQKVCKASVLWQTILTGPRSQEALAAAQRERKEEEKRRERERRDREVVRSHEPVHLLIFVNITLLQAERLQAEEDARVRLEEEQKRREEARNAQLEARWRAEEEERIEIEARRRRAEAAEHARLERERVALEEERRKKAEAKARKTEMEAKRMAEAKAREDEVKARQAEAEARKQAEERARVEKAKREADWKARLEQQEVEQLAREQSRRAELQKRVPAKLKSEQQNQEAAEKKGRDLETERTRAERHRQAEAQRQMQTRTKTQSFTPISPPLTPETTYANWKGSEGLFQAQTAAPDLLLFDPPMRRTQVLLSPDAFKRTPSDGAYEGVQTGVEDNHLFDATPQDTSLVLPIVKMSVSGQRVNERQPMQGRGRGRGYGRGQWRARGRGRGRGRGDTAGSKSCKLCPYVSRLLTCLTSAKTDQPEKSSVAS